MPFGWITEFFLANKSTFGLAQSTAQSVFQPTSRKNFLSHFNFKRSIPIRRHDHRNDRSINDVGSLYLRRHPVLYPRTALYKAFGGKGARHVSHFETTSARCFDVFLGRGPLDCSGRSGSFLVVFY